MNIRKELYINTNLINLEDSIYFSDRISSIVLNDIDFYNFLLESNYKECKNFDFYNSFHKNGRIIRHKVKEIVINNLSFYVIKPNSFYCLYYVELFSNINDKKIDNAIDKLFKYFKKQYKRLD